MATLDPDFRESDAETPTAERPERENVVPEPDNHENDENSSEEELLEEAKDQVPGLTQLQRLRWPISISAVMLTGLFILALLWFLYFARQLMLPIVLAVFANFLLTPFVRTAERWGIPRPVSGIVLVCALGLALLLGIYLLSGPASQFIELAPDRLDELGHKLRHVLGMVEELQETAKEVEEATGGESGADAQGPGPMDMAIQYARSLGAGILAAVILLIFLLCTDDIFLHKLVRVLPTMHDKRLAVEIIRQIESDVSHYLLTITIINAGLGTSVAILLWLIGTPTPALWGVMVGVLNFIPYVGPGIAMLVLVFVGLISYDSLSMAALPPLIVLGLNVLEANFITPLALGSRLDLNPVMIFIVLAFWGFLWGIPGMVVAVPLMVTVKIVCDHVKPLAPMSEFLSGSAIPPAGEEAADDN